MHKYINDCEFKRYLNQFDIIGLVETWCNFKGEFDSFMNIFCHFDCIRDKRNASFRNSGGVSVFVKNTGLIIKQIFQDFNDCIVSYIIQVYLI